MGTGITIELLATELNISVDSLIHQFSDIGLHKTNLDCVTLEEKNILLIHMNRTFPKSTMLNKLTLQRKTLSILNMFSSSGRSKKVQVEIRKKCTYMQCDDNKISEHEKESDRKIITPSECDDALFKSVSTKDDSLFCEKNLNSISSVIDKIHYQDGKDGVKKSFLSRQKILTSNNESKILETDTVSKDLRYNQYNKKNSTSELFHFSMKKKGNNTISNNDAIAPLKESGNSLGNNSKKKVNSDRRFRARQRLRSNKLRYSGKVNVNIKYKKNNHFDIIKYEYDDLHSVVRGVKSKQRKPSTLTHAFNKPTQTVSRDVIIGELITVSELANKMAVKSSQVIKMMMNLGAMVTINQVIDQQTACLVAEEMGHRVILRRENDLERKVMDDRDSFENSVSNILEYRAPIVTIMGHVDHGKTSLLDCIRSSKVASSEHGGITQHIGAYCVEISHSNNDKKMITFLDTPGHKAFTAMRLRGTQLTDIVVLVIAVDDGVMPQTIEAIQHVKVAKIPMIVALNKIDKVGSFDIDRIKHDLSKEGVISEAWGGETQFITVSAKSGVGIDDLLNAILLESELLELKSVRNGMASGVVIESFLDKGRGPVANVLVQKGTLKCGDIVLCGLEYGRVRSMRDDLGNNIILAGPSTPVEIFGLSGPPFAGDVMTVVRDERKAREVALYRQGKFRSVKLSQRKKSVFSNLLNTGIVEENVRLRSFNIVLKADLQGSVEAISNVLESFSNSDVKVNIVGAGVGRINETDVSLAIATRSILLGFNVQADTLSRKIIESESLDVYYHSVIYDLIDEVKRVMDSVLIFNDQDQKRVGLAEVRDVFSLPKLRNIAGCMVLEGIVRCNNKARIVRKDKVVYEGELLSLRRFKDDVNEVRVGMECGMVIKNYTDIHSGDCIEVFD